MRKQLEIELKVGMFVVIGVILVMAAILVLGSTENILTRKNHYNVHFSNVEGLIPGAKVVLGGLQIGTISSINFDVAQRNMRVEISVARDSAEWIRADSKAEIATQGMLGDKFIMLTTGSTDEPPLVAGSEIAVRPSQDLNQFLSKGDQLLMTLTSLAGSVDRMVKTFEEKNRSEMFFQGMAVTAKNLASVTEKLDKELDGLNARSAVKNLNSILEKINNGTGSLGALINDPELYDDAKALVGSTNRNRIMRNFVRQSIRKAQAEALENTPAIDVPKKQ